MQAEPSLNTAQSPEDHAASCWLALDRHVAEMGREWCGCYKHPVAGHIVTHKSCEVGEALAEEYEIASRRVREIQAAEHVRTANL